MKYKKVTIYSSVSIIYFVDKFHKLRPLPNPFPAPPSLVEKGVGGLGFLPTK